MDRLAEKDKCSGCTACSSACPEKCISMEYDPDGFLYPDIDLEKCIDCGTCTRVCPVLNVSPTYAKRIAYACINNSLKVRRDSSSGGVFTLIAEKILKENGVVFGAVFDEDFNVHHAAIESSDEIYKMRGSKYVQSHIGRTYELAEKYLKEGRKVLFSGVPCQINGLMAFLRKDYDNLITQDLICHGCPSNKTWQSYLKKIKEKTPGQKIKEISFRDKHSGLGNYAMSIKFEKTNYTIAHRKNTFLKAFLGNWSLRTSCYNCSAKGNNRKSDITLADFWGGESIVPEMFDGNGTSLVLINSRKGLDLFNEISEHMNVKKVEIDMALRHNSSEFSSVKKPLFKKCFMKELRNRPFDKVVNKYYKITLLKKVINKIKTLIK